MTEYERLISYGRKLVEDYVLVAEKQLAKIYKESYEITKGQLSDFYTKFGSQLDLIEAKKYSRLENLMQSIGDEYRKITGKAIQITGDTSMQSVTGGFNTTWFNMEQTLKQSLEFGIIPVDAVRASVFSEISGANFEKRFGKLYTSGMERISEEITRGIATGQGYAKTASSLKDLFNGQFYQAVRVVRTESARNYTEGDLYGYEQAFDAGVKGSKVWLSTFDGRTRDSHARLNGQAADKDGLFHIGSDSALGPGLFSEPENSINCRCSTYLKIDGVEGAPTFKYETWEKKYNEWLALAPKDRPRKFSQL